MASTAVVWLDRDGRLLDRARRVKERQVPDLGWGPGTGTRAESRESVWEVGSWLGLLWGDWDAAGRWDLLCLRLEGLAEEKGGRWGFGGLARFLRRAARSE